MLGATSGHTLAQNAHFPGKQSKELKRFLRLTLSPSTRTRAYLSYVHPLVELHQRLATGVQTLVLWHLRFMNVTLLEEQPFRP